MTRYLLATQQAWGVKVFDILKSRGGDWWMTRTVAGMRASINPPVRYVFCVNFSSYVPPDVLAMAEIVNFHAFGPGPIWHRGGGPIEGLLLRGYTETTIGARGPISLAGTKAEILDRFIEPCVDLIRWIVETEPEPYPQVGEVVNFTRLDKASYEAFWKGRA